ncbi:MAG: hypothetical protein WEB04_08735 [Dehalococcoidia bacterium]
MVLKIRPRRLGLFAALVIAAVLAFGSAACGDGDDNGDSTATPEPAAETMTPEGGATPAPSATPAASDIGEDSAPVMAARQALLDNVAINPADLHFVSATSMTFSNACLDVEALSATPEVCAQVITPGYEIVFQAGSTVYTYRTDESATNVRFADVDIGGGPSEIDVP